MQKGILDMGESTMNKTERQLAITLELQRSKGQGYSLMDGYDIRHFRLSRMTE
ncbi:hypothetical protein [Paenibacillus sp. PCH8]|uniref:hypothetical protein n=1 Tax=Paenibacillus sp. PCH8 TaxID=2066524 RepID=UPI0015E35664|nr:hypothetical protein [Paenibacillus sp. PCH8]